VRCPRPDDQHLGPGALGLACGAQFHGTAPLALAPWVSFSCVLRIAATGLDTRGWTHGCRGRAGRAKVALKNQASRLHGETAGFSVGVLSTMEMLGTF